eukprot:3439459-Pleurochrysis_carterae.AAC.1
MEAVAGEQAGQEQESGVVGGVDDGGPARAGGHCQVPDAAEHQGLRCAEALQGLGPPSGGI